MSDWIRISDRLPEFGTKVWVVWLGIVQHVAYALDEDGWVAATAGDDDVCPFETFTHWMPLPDPPKQDTP